MNNETPQKCTKLEYINSLELTKEKEVEIDERPKYFVTFPIPYMNGKLHLGHLFSISKADFMAHFKEMQGYNVLFPLSFHCTGMPISASAQKLKEELSGIKTDISTKEILQSLGFEDVTPFIDPIYWIKTFPGFCINSLKKFGANIDWRRSFITTDINKYFDSFVKWQFYKLKKLGYISFGKKHTIFCPKDKQTCLDHDRRKGENVKPIKIILCKIYCKNEILLIKLKNKGNPIKIILGENINLIKFKYKDKIYFTEEIIYNNIIFQVTGIQFIEKINISKEKFSNMMFDKQLLNFEFVKNEIIIIKTENKLNKLYEHELKKLDEKEIASIDNLTIEEGEKFCQTDNFISIYIPEDEVISRSGSVCVVSLSDQWYIDYSNVEWKKKVKECFNLMECDIDTRSKLYEGVDWINKWGFSRSFGLGTRIPWDEQYLIDSLSDSDIYMTFYTFKHLLFEDLEGKIEKFPSAELCNEIWDFIFGFSILSKKLNKYKDILIKCKENFEFFYPVDLRVSGKDLIKNHLLFYVFNHVAIFDKKYWPKRIYTNGHLMLNSEKMSKSTGNFMTVDDVFEKYGVSATRMCLAVAGDTNEDANFVESNSNMFILKLFTLCKNIECRKNIKKHLSNQDILNLIGKTNIDQLFIEMLSLNITNTIFSYEIMKYSDVVKYGFFEILHFLTLYNNLKGDNDDLINFTYKVIVQLMYPIIPDLSRKLIKEYFNDDFTLPKPLVESNENLLAFRYVEDVAKKILTNKRAKESDNCIISVGKGYPTWKKQVMEYIDSLNVERNSNVKKDKECISKILEKAAFFSKNSEIKIKNANIFSMDYLLNPKKYKVNFEEFKVLKEYSFYIEKLTKKKIEIRIDLEQEPLNPKLIF